MFYEWLFADIDELIDCDFEDKCELCPDECGNENYSDQKGTKASER